MRYRKHAYVGISLAIITSGALFALSYVSTPAAACLTFLPTVFWIYSGWFTAKAKGQHPAWGLLGIADIVGLIVLSLFPDHYQFELDASTKRYQFGLRLTLIALILAGLGYIISL